MSFLSSLMNALTRAAAYNNIHCRDNVAGQFCYISEVLHQVSTSCATAPSSLQRVSIILSSEDWYF